MAPGSTSSQPSAALSAVVTSRSPEATERLAGHLAAVAEPGDLIALVGDLGAGKTRFAKGFAAGLGVAATVNSPSFVLMTEYTGRLPLFHLDLYRLADASDALASGLLDERQREGVTLVEWADRFGSALPATNLRVTIEGTGEDPRTIRLVAGVPALARYLEVVP